MKRWEIIADNLGKAGWSWGCVSTVDSYGRTIFVADAHRDDGKRFVVSGDENQQLSLNSNRRLGTPAKINKKQKALPLVVSIAVMWQALVTNGRGLAILLPSETKVICLFRTAFRVLA